MFNELFIIPLMSGAGTATFFFAFQWLCAPTAMFCAKKFHTMSFFEFRNQQFFTGETKIVQTFDVWLFCPTNGTNQSAVQDQCFLSCLFTMGTKMMTLLFMFIDPFFRNSDKYVNMGKNIRTLTIPQSAKTCPIAWITSKLPVIRYFLLYSCE